MPMMETAMVLSAPEAMPLIADDRSSHHPFGPSRWPALMQCPNWQGRSGDEAAKRGTELHSVFEAALTGKKPEPNDVFEANVLRAAETILAMAGTPERWWIEEHVWVYTPGGVRTDIFGRVDAAWEERSGELHVVELKMMENGDRDYRPQLLAYAFGLIGEGPVPATVHLHMVFADSGRVTHEILPISEAWREYAEIYGRIDEIMWTQAPLPSVQSAWCNLCSRIAECQAPRAVAQKVADTLADVPERWPEYSPARKAQLCVLADAVIKWGEAVKENAAEDAKAGEVIEDPTHGIYYGTQERKGRLVIDDAQCAWGILKPYLTAEGYRRCLSVKPSDLKAALRETGMKSAEVNAMVERCGIRGPATTVFVRRGVKVVA